MTSAARAFVKRRYKQARGEGVHRREGPGYVEFTGPHFAAVRNVERPEPRQGIFLRGACDLPSLFGAMPLIREEVVGTVCLRKAPGKVEDSRVDLLLQTLDPPSPEHTAETMKRLGLAPHYFRPDLFDPTFTVKGMPKLGEFPKTVVVLSLAANVLRTLYRHRQHGFLVDPGGSWLNRSVAAALADRKTHEWFTANFERVGRLSVDDFHAQFRTLAREVVDRTGAKLVVTNLLCVEPPDRAHNYQLRPHPEALRRRRFNLALVDLSRELGFHVLDVDRALKGASIDPTLDFGHFDGDTYGSVADAFYRTFRDLSVI